MLHDLIDGTYRQAKFSGDSNNIRRLRKTTTRRSRADEAPRAACRFATRVSPRTFHPNPLFFPHEKECAKRAISAKSRPLVMWRLDARYPSAGKSRRFRSSSDRRISIGRTLPPAGAVPTFPCSIRWQAGRSLCLHTAH
jgi:hypothetical protein